MAAFLATILRISGPDNDIFFCTIFSDDEEEDVFGLSKRLKSLDDVFALLDRPDNDASLFVVPVLFNSLWRLFLSCVFLFIIRISSVAFCNGFESPLFGENEFIR